VFLCAADLGKGTGRDLNKECTTALCSGVLQCVAVYVAVCCSEDLKTKAWVVARTKKCAQTLRSSVAVCVAVCCSVLQRVLQHVLQRVLQHVLQRVLQRVLQ